MSRIVVVGASGFIGSAIAARLAASGHDIVAVARRRPQGMVSPNVAFELRDLRDMTDAAAWRPLIRGADAVVNCAGVLQDRSAGDVHRAAPAALFEACGIEGVRRVVHFSAIGVDRAQRSDFSSTKLAGDEALMQCDLDWVILRPALVAGPEARGGAALLRLAAAMPVMIAPRAEAPISVVQLDDVVETAAVLARSDAPSKIVLELAGEPTTLADAAAEYRRWLGWPAAKHVALPAPFAALLFALGDAAAFLGWRTAMRRNAYLELERGAIGDPGPWTRATGVRPRTLRDALAATPATADDRRSAALALLQPILVVLLAFFWIGTGMVALWPGFDAGVAYMEKAQAGGLSALAVIAGGVADIAIGAGLLHRRTIRPALVFGVATSLFYFAAGTALLPVLWIDPIGPMLKIAPIVALHAALSAIVGER